MHEVKGQEGLLLSAVQQLVQEPTEKPLKVLYEYHYWEPASLCVQWWLQLQRFAVWSHQQVELTVNMSFVTVNKSFGTLYAAKNLGRSLAIASSPGHSRFYLAAVEKTQE